jgi:serine/threonine protein kinase
MIEERDIVNECYILRERVGEDTFSEWWRASAIFVASNFLLRFIKDGFVTDEATSKAFLKLARKRINIVSPAILSLVEVDRFKDRFFIASEYDGHKNLRTILDSGRRFTVEHACRLVIELAEGVGTFHQRDEAFGVLTPEGIVVHGFGDRIDEIKLLLPGYEPFFASILEDRVEDFKQTWGYASPELKRGKPSDQKSDLYSLGVLLFRLLTGKLPYGSRSGIRVRTRSASPAHIAAALARRGIPRELTTTTVRALRKNPLLRHDDIMVFITELRSILDVRREAWIKAGKVDPIADLATLNLKKAKADAREIVRSLETVNYFRYLGDSGDVAELSPIETIEADEEVIELEEIEAEQGDDDDTIATEAYVEAGYQVAEGRSRKNAKTTPPSPAIAAKEPARAPGQAPVTEVATPGPKPAGQPVKEPEKHRATAPSVSPGSEYFSSAETVTVVSHTVAPGFVAAGQPGVPEKSVQDYSRANDRRSAGNPNDPVYWKHAGGSPMDVAEKLNQAVVQAAEGNGIVRFIQDPDSGESARIVAAALDALRTATLMIDMGALPPGAGIDQLVNRLGSALGPGSMPERKPGASRSADRSSVTKSTRALAERVADALVARSDRARPLVIIARGTSTVAPSAHRFFVELASRAIHAPLCAFLFFGAEPIPKWHVLASMRTKRLR